ncbi:hypothetical protein M422DRAFT_29469 [Sphaerobolus stellatus SS14]|uniref:DUF2415 domain-containing protein n=1 Tax=Sphaerobolus stellatus (strain SS14) TaxID=990650 RepID=A0A0C9W459_SPHS4|nr:hypothetical protein M422DRAFT_29469 [Sphaerobolus stellatus SS14]
MAGSTIPLELAVCNSDDAINSLLLPRPTASFIDHPTTTHTQLRHLLVCPSRRGLVYYVKGKAIIESDLLNPALPARAIVEFDYNPSCLAASVLPSDSKKIIFGVGGIHSQLNLFLLALSPSFGPTRPSSKVLWKRDSPQQHSGRRTFVNTITFVPTPLLDDTKDVESELRMVVAGNNKIVQVYDLCLQSDTKSKERMKQCGQLFVETCVNYLSISPDGRTLLCAGDTPKVYLYRISPGSNVTFTEIATYTLPPPPASFFASNSSHPPPSGYVSRACFSAAWSPDGLKFAIASQEGQLCVWDVRSATPVFEYWMKYRKNTSKHITELWGCGIRSLLFTEGKDGRGLLVWVEHTTNIHAIDSRSFDERTHQVIRFPGRLSVEPSSTFRSGQSTHNPTTNGQAQYRDSTFLHESPPIPVHHPWRTLRFGLASPHQDSDALPSSPIILQTPPEDGDVEMRSPSPPSPVVISHGHDNPSRSPPSPGLSRVHRRRSVSQPSTSNPYGPTISELRTIRNHTRRTISDRLRQLHQDPASISTAAERAQHREALSFVDSNLQVMAEMFRQEMDIRRLTEENLELASVERLESDVIRAVRNLVTTERNGMSGVDYRRMRTQILWMIARLEAILDERRGVPHWEVAVAGEQDRRRERVRHDAQEPTDGTEEPLFLTDIESDSDSSEAGSGGRFRRLDSNGDGGVSSRNRRESRTQMGATSVQDRRVRRATPISPNGITPGNTRELLSTAPSTDQDNNEPSNTNNELSINENDEQPSSVHRSISASGLGGGRGGEGQQAELENVGISGMCLDPSGCWVYVAGENGIVEWTIREKIEGRAGGVGGWV